MEKSVAGEWVCGTCECQNFRWRTKCRRCNQPSASLSRVHTSAPGPRVRNFRPGDWYCDAGLCQAHNFANRQSCFRCGTVKSIPFFDSTAGYFSHSFSPVNCHILGQRVAKISRRGWTTGDWFCGRLDCNAHNYGLRVRCYRCNTPKELASKVI